MHCAQCFVSPPLLLLWYSFVGALSLWSDVLKGTRCKGFHSVYGGMLFWVTGRLHVVMVRVVLSLPSIPGISGFSSDLRGFHASGFLIPLSC